MIITKIYIKKSLTNFFVILIYIVKKIAKLENIKIIGHITSPSLGMRLVTRDGNEIDFKAQGWNAFEE